jgi:hypothetical protein
MNWSSMSRMEASCLGERRLRRASLGREFLIATRLRRLHVMQKVGSFLGYTGRDAIVDCLARPSQGTLHAKKGRMRLGNLATGDRRGACEMFEGRV